ncbi:MAG: DUF2231 domain-containing protein [Candidatus Kapabacteria bacterium]|nr:DUF2231 domain-containing protein [Candidatus Kapabacteria bacterium]
MRYKFALILVIFFTGILYLTAYAHRNHEQQEKIKDSLEHKVDTAMSNHSNMVMDSEHSDEEKPYNLNYPEEIFSHVHNKLVHFPVALSILGFLFTIISFKRKQFEFSIKYIVLIAAIFSIPTVITGLYQADNFIGEPKEWIVNIHKILGITLSGLLWIWVIFLSFKPLKKYAWVIAFISASITTITAFYGGIAAAAH